MSTETNREVIGATTKGEVTVLTKAVADHDYSGEMTKLGTKDVFLVRQGPRTVLETTNGREAASVAKALVSADGIVDAGVDETPVKRAETKAEADANAKAERPKAG